MLEICEPRTLMSATTAGKVFEPLNFSAVELQPKGVPISIAGTLNLHQGAGSKVTGTLVEANGTRLKVDGSLQGQQISLQIHTSSKNSIEAVGPVVSATTAQGQRTLDGGGEILGGHNKYEGTFTLQGSDVVLPVGHLQSARSVKTIVPAGTTLVPTDFSGVVRQGTDAGTTLVGKLSLGKVGKNGTFAGTLADPVNGTVPVSGQIVGGQIKLTFDLGGKGKFGGVGPFMAQKVGPGQVKLIAFGSLQTGNPTDSGDWELISSSLSGQNLSNETNLSIDYAGVLVSGTNFTGSTFIGLFSPDSEFIGVSFHNAFLEPFPPSNSRGIADGPFDFDSTNLYGVDFSGATLTDVSFNVDDTSEIGTGLPASLVNANFTGAKLTADQFGGANLTGANLTGANLNGVEFGNANLANANLAGATVFNTSVSDGVDFSGVNLTGADLRGTHFVDPTTGNINTNPSFLPAKTQIVYQLQNGLNGAGLNLSGQDLSGEDLRNVDLTGANLTGADLSKANLSGAILSRAILTNANLSGSNLTGADLSKANLTGATLSPYYLIKLTGANLSGANLSGQNLASFNLTGDNLSGANLTGTTLTSANLSGDNLSGATLTGATLTRANLRGSVITNAIGLSAKTQLVFQLQNQGGVGLNLSGKDLSGEDLSSLNLTGANLSGANLSGAYLYDSSLNNANLTGANLTGAELFSANLTGANLTGTGLTAANLTSMNATYNSTTIFG